MASRSRLLAVPLLLVLLPCAAVGWLGYRWLRLEQEAVLRRSRDAAELEAARVRAALVEHLRATAQQTARAWARRRAGDEPFAPPPEPPDIVVSACVLSARGELLFPDYEETYRRLVREHELASRRGGWAHALSQADASEGDDEAERTARELGRLVPQTSSPNARASLLLALGRLSLTRRDYRAAETRAREILDCCARARDEYGLSFALYAAAQLASVWRAQRTLEVRFPELAATLGNLIDRGVIGYPSDLSEIALLVHVAAKGPSSAELLQRAGRAAERIRRQIEEGRRLQKWLAGSTMLARQGERFVLSTWWEASQPQLVGVHRNDDGSVLVLTVATERLAKWVSGLATADRRFDAALALGREGATGAAGATLRTALFPEAPGFELLLQAKDWDPVVHQRRQFLFTGALAAALLLVVAVGYFALRDIARELQLASLRANFVAGVTHELKTPLTSIRLLAETLQLKRARDPGSADRLLESIVDETDRLGRLLDNVLSFASIDRGSRIYQPTELELGSTVETAAQRLHHILTQGGFHLEREGNWDGLRVCADRDALLQAVLNLLDNAVKYAGASREIRLGVHRAGNEAEIRVTDHGIGIPPAEQPRIFERFYRVPEAARETSGAGLGLALVRHFAEAHAGRVTVVSQPGKGSTFSLWLPLLGAPGAARERRAVIDHANNLGDG